MFVLTGWETGKYKYWHSFNLESGVVVGRIMYFSRGMWESESYYL